MKVFAAGIGAAATGVAALGTAAVNSYADFEQLVGGVDTLFKESSQKVQKYADNAYKTAGLSANEYMETVTSFSASLLQSLEGDTVKAADAADQAIIDMSDNANKMGTSMEMIQNAYQGFAKQNYTMLDNLKLGYGGTKTEMERLLADATKLSGIEYDISNLADVYEAIHVVQTELGITGTTAKEASETIAGSASAMKAAWSNLLTGLADENADFDALIDNLVDSVGTFGDNVLPRVEVVLLGISDLIEQLLPKVLSEIPELINGVLPDLLKAGANILKAIMDGMRSNMGTVTNSFFEVISTLGQAAIELLPQFLDIGFEMLTNMLQGLVDNMPAIFEGIQTLFNNIIESINQWLPSLIEMGLQMIVSLVIGIAESLPTLIPTIIDVLLTIVDTLISNIDMLVDAGISLIMGLAEGLINAIPVLIEKIPIILQKLVEGIIRNAPKMVEAGNELIVMLWNAIKDGWNNIVAYFAEMVPELIKSIGEWFSQLPENIAYWLGYVLTKVIVWGAEMRDKALSAALNFLNSIIDTIKQLPEKFTEWLNNVVDEVPKFEGNLLDALADLPGKMLEIGSNIVEGLWNGISDGWDWLVSSVKDLANSLFEGAKDALDIHSPSRKFKWIGEMCVAGFDDGISDLMNADALKNNIDASLSIMQMNAQGGQIASIGGFGNFNQTLNIYQPVSTPDELARAVRLESKYGLMRGVPVG